MLTWNYRVIRKEQDGEIWFQIHECFYDKKKDKIPTSWTVHAIAPIGETLKDLKWTLKMMKRCLKKPVLIEVERGGVMKLEEVK